ncbi:MAG: AAA family ATPase [Phycisphaerae bacterium]
MQIKRLTVQNMWSFGPDSIAMEKLCTTNVLIGKNNSGKSNLLNAIKWFGQSRSEQWILGNEQFQLPHSIVHRGSKGGRSVTAAPPTGLTPTELASRFTVDGKRKDERTQRITEILETLLALNQARRPSPNHLRPDLTPHETMGGLRNIPPNTPPPPRHLPLTPHPHPRHPPRKPHQIHPQPSPTHPPNNQYRITNNQQF